MNKFLPVAAIAVLLLSACSSNEPAPAASVSAPVAAVDRTADVTAALDVAGAAAITSAEETEPGRVVISTSIVDPRGDNGSAEAVLAVSICDVVSAMPGVEHVSIMEADGTTFVLFGHPSVPAGACAEV